MSSVVNISKVFVTEQTEVPTRFDQKRVLKSFGNGVIVFRFAGPATRPLFLMDVSKTQSLAGTASHQSGDSWEKPRLGAHSQQ